MSADWWTDEDVARAFHAMDGICVWVGNTDDAGDDVSHDGTIESDDLRTLSRAALAALTPTVERIRREAKAEAFDDGVLVGLAAYSMDDSGPNPYRIEAGGDDE